MLDHVLCIVENRGLGSLYMPTGARYLTCRSDSFVDRGWGYARSYATSQPRGSLCLLLAKSAKLISVLPNIIGLPDEVQIVDAGIDEGGQKS